MTKRKRIGILTSGGDCPGLNAVIRAVVNYATCEYNWEVRGIPYATQGLIERKSVVLNRYGLERHGIDPLLSMGGTILGSINKGDTEAQADEVISGYHDLELDALIAIGGDGSLAILHKLAKKGNMNLVGVPKTIDNDVACTELSVGFNSAVSTILDSLDRLSCTAASHDRVMVVEVMGRTTGHLALHSGIVGGADAILIPEIRYSVSGLCKRIQQLRNLWERKFAIVVVAEGAKTTSGESRSYKDALGEVRLRGIGEYVATEIETTLGVESRATVLGHVQRGGAPSSQDRLLATAFGKTAVDVIAAEDYGKMVAWSNHQVVTVSLEKVFQNSPRLLDPNGFWIETARALGVYLGEESEIHSTCSTSQNGHQDNVNIETPETILN
ncbi:MAG: ATP-dependent 6-phosphofructokinase [Limnospira sp. PMC 1291.21]|uniref:ATP-dependent 6-phosphofructokinase n=3 Tax=Limnospira TaxID=2596745 RepID=A0A9P1NXC1_9CYAN|nr:MULTISPECIES: ATP-dependent 6-phosphofructokinase [Limnospira]EKD11011.1 6-phosphofructokinase [Arthrospira platensis C1]MDC0840376.1 ATP-dependent 6-phosphofructokinase [Limnoraphis robusta]MDY7051276.1 ATP-dependent 6-phosphofructokinase [Limnospira fusiformis LS22]QJB29634.1 ATP-dependent 6-phosphofructokinase [Limnospira fusiformis SAG 85.79]EDZ92097.1 6-phosphofructokinase [Limnospira maxima CS-328]